MLYFSLGMIIGHTSRDYSVWTWVVLFVLGLIVSTIEARYLFNNYGSGIGIKPSAMLVSVSTILLVFSQRSEEIYNRLSISIRNFLERVGEYSFAIYLTHCYLKLLFVFVPVLNCGYWSLRWGGGACSRLSAAGCAPKSGTQKALAIHWVTISYKEARSKLENKSK